MPGFNNYQAKLKQLFALPLCVVYKHLTTGEDRIKFLSLVEDALREARLTDEHNTVSILQSTLYRLNEEQQKTLGSDLTNIHLIMQKNNDENH